MPADLITPEMRILGIAVAVLFSLVVFELVRRRALLEKYAFAWIIVSFILLLVAIFPDVFLNGPAHILKISIPANMLFLLGFIATGAFLLRLTVHISKLNEKLTRLTQELAIIRLEIEKEESREEK